MFIKFLKLFLYLIFFGCVIWGAVLIGAPSALKFIINKTFGESVTLYNLRITPKLDILISRIEISDLEYQNKSIDGSIRSLETQITGFFNLKPTLNVSSGQIRLNDAVSIDKAKASFSFPGISLASEANLNVELTEIISHDLFSSKYLTARGRIDVQKRMLTDANITAQNVSALKDLAFKSSSVTGSLSNWDLSRDETFPPNSLNLEFQNLKFPTRKIYADHATLSSDLLGDKYSVVVKSDELMVDNYYLAREVFVYLTAASPDIDNIEEFKLNANSINLPRSRFLETGEAINLSIDLLKNNNLEYDLFANAKLIEAKFTADDLPIANLPSSTVEISSKYTSDGDFSSKIKTEFKLKSETELFIGMDAIAAVDISGNNIFDCTMDTCVFSNFSLDYDLMAHQGKLSGYLDCPRFPCKGSAVEHKIVTNNTASFFESASKSRIFNPIFLAFIYGNLLDGEQVGDGHSFRF